MFCNANWWLWRDQVHGERIHLFHNWWTTGPFDNWWFRNCGHDNWWFRNCGQWCIG
jgi:hypothetical protein